MNQSEREYILLTKVLRTCRAKSNVSISEWYKLKDQIESFLAGSQVDLDKIFTVKREIITKTKVKHNPASNRELISENAHYKLELSRVTAENRSLEKQLKSKDYFIKGVQSLLSALYKNK